MFAHLNPQNQRLPPPFEKKTSHLRKKNKKDLSTWGISKHATFFKMGSDFYPPKKFIPSDDDHIQSWWKLCVKRKHRGTRPSWSWSTWTNIFVLVFLMAKVCKSHPKGSHHWWNCPPRVYYLYYRKAASEMVGAWIFVHRNAKKMEWWRLTSKIETILHGGVRKGSMFPWRFSFWHQHIGLLSGWKKARKPWCVMKSS